MNAPLITAGAIVLCGAALHGLGGEGVMKTLSPELLPASRFGGPRTTKSMIHISWHMTTIAFLSVGVALLVSGAALHGDTARGVGLVAAGASTGFAALSLAMGATSARTPRFLLRHPAPLLLTLTAALAWWGVA